MNPEAFILWKDCTTPVTHIRGQILYTPPPDPAGGSKIPPLPETCPLGQKCGEGGEYIIFPWTTTPKALKKEEQHRKGLFQPRKDCVQTKSVMQQHTLLDKSSCAQRDAMFACGGRARILNSLHASLTHTLAWMLKIGRKQTSNDDSGAK